MLRSMQVATGNAAKAHSEVKSDLALSQARYADLVAQANAVAAQIDQMAVAQFVPLIVQMNIILEAGGDAITYIPLEARAADLADYYYDLIK